MEEEEVKQIIDRERLTGYTREYIMYSRPNMILIGKQPEHRDFWQIVEEEKENENGHRMAHFSSEGEVWRWFLERLREKNGRGGDKTGGETSCYLSRKDAEEIIRQEGLTHYHIDPGTKEKPGDLVLRKCRHWEIYEIKEEDMLPKRLPSIRYNEKEAWGFFIRELKDNRDNTNLQARRRQKERDREREEKLKREAIKTHIMARERAEQILIQEKLTGYNKNEPREDRPEEMVIRRKGENWEVYCTDSKGEVHGEKELFTVEEEAWGWFIKGVRDNAKIREINRKLFGQDCLFAKIER